MKKRKEPRWVVPFVRALERTGEARAAAKDAGIDQSTAYARRRAHGEFASRWAEALAAHAARVKAEEDAEIMGIEAGRASPLAARAPRESPSSAERGGRDLVVSGGKVRRAGAERWSGRKERIFFDELAATANITMAAEAAGVSTNAVHARRLRHPLFAAKWAAVEAAARATISMQLIEQTRKSFDLADLDTGDVKPRVTIDQAIRISQSGGASKWQRQAADAPEEKKGCACAYDVADVRARLEAKLRHIGEQDRREKLSAGWTLDQSYGVMVPPGYVQGPDYTPKPPEDC
jgi:hypothetical protein